MWLSQDERRLLVRYYGRIGEVHREERFDFRQLWTALGFHGSSSDLTACMRSETPNRESPEGQDELRKTRRYLEACRRIPIANRLLAARGLITAVPHEHEPHVVIVTLTVEGYDLGRRYSNFLDRSGLWFEHWRNHWLWLIAACVGGALITQILHCILRAW
jgi:hypothetical protein